MWKANVGYRAKMIPNYKLEFILHTHNGTDEGIRSCLSEFGECLEVSACGSPDDKGSNFMVRLVTQEPTAIFDICGQIGRIRQVKINEDP